MRKTILTAVAVLSIGGVAAGTLIANAQPAPPAATVDSPAAPPPGAPPMGGPGGPHGGPPWMMRWMHPHPPGGPGGGPAGGPAAFALIYRPADRQLQPADVQKIAEAFLLWNGNRDWKVTNVAAGADNQIAFSLATADGSVIAKFSMDSKTGRVTRTG